MANSKLTKAAIVIFLITILAKALGLLKEMLLAYKFGTSYIVDAYMIAISFPSIVFATFASGIAEAYIPSAARIVDENKRNYFTNNIMTIITLISVIFMVVSLILSGQITHILAPGFTGYPYELTKTLLQIVIVMLPVMVVYNIYNAHLLYNEYFIVVNFVNSLILNILILISILCASEERTMILAVGYVISYMIVMGIYIGFSRCKTSLRYSIACNLQDENFKELIKMAIPIGFSLIVIQVNSMVDKILASGLGEGVIAALGYANKIQLLFYSMVTSVVMSVCFPRISQHFSKGEYDKGLHYVRKAFITATYAGIPVAIILIFFSEQITSLLFERGSFYKDSTIITSQCVLFYAIGMIFYSYREIFSRVLMANKGQKKILKNTMFVVVINVVLSILLNRILEYIGLALATSVAGMIAAILMYMDTRKENLFYIDKELFVEIIKIIVASSISIIICLLGFDILKDLFSENVVVIIIMVLFSFVYLGVSFVLKIDVLMSTVNRIFKKK